MTAHSISSASIISRSQDVVSGNIDGEIVMMHIKAGMYYGLDDVASRIWELTEEPLRVDTLIDRLLDEYNVDRTTCERDVLDFLEDLHQGNILEIVLG
ncbi:MAG: lasso peptide biosynthesis PqqD family chaperone [Deltaproteobacteria bacterium]|nr:lasso peptide biosynthesis PqqD family chaperone [Deltaproteobacteria bacterium]